MNSFISWIGGKRLLRKDIIARFPKEKIERYIEVFGGAGWVLFAKDKHADFEVYNNVNSNLVNLFRCVKYHPEELHKELSFVLNSREILEDYKNQFICNGLTDIQRAARFMYLVKVSYGSSARTYGCVKKNLKSMIDYILTVQERLNTVVIENKDFEDLIKVYDRLGALFYLDPPYFRTERYYNVEFKEEDHVRLRDTLNNIQGKFILSYNDCEFVRELYKDYNIEEIERNSNLVNRYDDIDHSYKELIIRNY